MQNRKQIFKGIRKFFLCIIYLFNSIPLYYEPENKRNNNKAGIFHNKYKNKLQLYRIEYKKT